MTPARAAQGRNIKNATGLKIKKPQSSAHRLGVPGRADGPVLEGAVL